MIQALAATAFPRLPTRIAKGPYFHIISKDTGFDPLIAHLKDQKIFAQREKDPAEILLIRLSNASSVKEKLEAIVKNLTARGHSRLRKVKTLSNTINSMFMKKLEESELKDISEKMIDKNLVVIQEEKVSDNSPIVLP